MRPQKDAFTLIEILLVALILVVIAGLTIPRFAPTYTKFQLKKTADDLAYLMRYAQSRAVTRNRLLHLEFDSNFSKYWLTQQELNEDEPTGVFERFRGRWGRTFTVPEAMTIETDQPKIRFFPDGTMDKRRVVVCHEERCLAISTREKRGSVHVFKIDP